ncbi:MFS transporter [Nesterenkonia xinjiangensis]|uniref:Putative MFS family arabinose efflux permease n=1 Tax=Nesterenkonia xinjiangensis TaxID=225327 RepID=A0A7Z0K7M4_9MICC|nr:MFS transporter [Nesterenkonia xinjiangensis]NYJ76699.1 putative MFS family arabinose efflux permease [Nesterenkonia xinjiangensis]
MSASAPRLAPRVVVSFIGTLVLAYLAANLVPVLIGALVNDLGFTVAHAGNLVTLMSLGTATGLFAANRFVARGDRATVARTGLTGMVIGFGSAAAVLTPSVVQVGVIIGGISCGVVMAAGIASTAVTMNPDKTTTMVTIVNRAGAALLLAVVPLLGNDLQHLLTVLALLGAAGLFAAGGLPNLPVQEKPTGRLLPFTPAAILLAAVFGLWSLSEDMVYAMLEILAVQNVGLSPGQSSVVISLQIIGGLTGAVVAPLVLARIGRSLSIFGILVLSSTAKFLIVSSTAAPVFLAANVAWGLAYGAALVLVLGLAARMDVSGRVGVLVSTIYIIGIALGPAVGGILVTYTSPLMFATMVSAVSVVAGLVLLMISRRSGVPERGGDRLRVHDVAAGDPLATFPQGQAATSTSGAADRMSR